MSKTYWQKRLKELDVLVDVLEGVSHAQQSAEIRQELALARQASDIVSKIDGADAEYADRTDGLATALVREVEDFLAKGGSEVSVQLNEKAHRALKARISACLRQYQDK